MLYVKEYDGEEKGKEEMNSFMNRMLEAYQVKFPLLMDLDLAFTLEEVNQQAGRFTLVSEPLPLSSLGVWAYSVNYVVMQVVCSKSDHGYHGYASFQYRHRSGGANSSVLAGLGESATYMTYDEESDTFGFFAHFDKLLSTCRSLSRLKAQLGDLSDSLHAAFRSVETLEMDRETLGEKDKRQIADAFAIIHSELISRRNNNDSDVKYLLEDMGDLLRDFTFEH